VVDERDCGTTDQEYEVEFREAIANTIPVLNKRLRDEDKDIRQKTAKLVDKLATHGEFQVKSRCSTADQALKPSFMRPSRA
jgi:hypothetical protein